jgi:hypothetical protein
LIEYDLTAGQTYYIGVKLYSGTGSFTFAIDELEDYKINSIAICDMSERPLQTIPKDKFVVSISFTNIESKKDAVIVLAQYTSNNELKGLEFIGADNTVAGTTEEFTVTVDNTNGDIARLKAFSWASFSSLVPVSNSVSFPAE